MSHLSGSRSWFEGTMEVISGITPRPSTPQPHSSGNASMHGGRSMSAPNSPARPGFLPSSINRLPSQDSLDRSIHNESGHGKSTAQIIRDLKHSNSALSAKSASMEARFMNQMAEATREFQAEQKKLEDANKLKDKQLSQFEVYKTKTQEQLKERDGQLSKMKEESAFQRHTISDLKSQLYQLQSEMEEQDKAREEEYQQVVLDNKDMLREIKALQQQLREKQLQEQQQQQQQQLQEQQQQQQQQSRDLGKPPQQGSHSPDKTESTGQITANNSIDSEDSTLSKQHEVLQQLEQTQGELEDHRTRLSLAQENLRDLQTEKEELSNKHQAQLSEMESQLMSQSNHFKTRESTLLEQLQGFDTTNEDLLEMRNQVDDKDEEIATLRQDLRKLADHAADLQDELDKLRQDATNQEQYRRDEVEDLRVLHDAQEVEIDQMRKKLEDADQELEIREQELDDRDRQLLDLPKIKEAKEHLAAKVADLEAEIKEKNRELEELQEEKNHRLTSSSSSTAASTRSGNGNSNDDGDEVIASRSLDASDGDNNAFRDTDDSNSLVSKLEQELQNTKDEHVETLEALEVALNGLRLQKRDLEEDCEKFQMERDEAVATLEKELANMEQARREQEQAMAEVEELREQLNGLKGTSEIAEQMKNQLVESDTAWKAMETDVQKLQAELDAKSGIEIELHEFKARNMDLHKQMEVSKTTLSDLEAKSALQYENEIEKLKDTICDMEVAANKLKKQLREAQIALVAVDEEKLKIKSSSSESIAIMERQKRDLEQQLQLVRKERDTMKSEFDIKRAALMKQLNDQQASANRQAQDAKKVDKLIEETVERLKAENDLKLRVMKDKLKDRETTISALVKSSLPLEDKIVDLESQVETLKHNEQIKRDETNVAKQKAARMAEDVVTVKRQLDAAKADAGRWKRAVREDSSSSTRDYRYRIAKLEKDIYDSTEKLSERDSAIDNLVNQSMSQDGQIKTLKSKVQKLQKEVEIHRSAVAGNKRYGDESAVKAEIHRLKQESEIFAGQIIEQDEEIEALKRDLQLQEKDSATLRAQIMEHQLKDKSRSVVSQTEIDDLNLQVSTRDKTIADLNRTLGELKRTQLSSAVPHNNSMEFVELQAEVDELREANREMRSELRDIRRQLWDAKEAAGKSGDLKIELEQAKYALEEQKRKAAGNSPDIALQRELGEAKANMDAMKQRLSQIETLESKLKERDQTIASFDQKTAADNEAQILIFQNEISSLRKKISEMDTANDNLQRALKRSEAEKESFEIELADENDKVPSKELDKLTKEKSELMEFNNEMKNEITDLKEKLESMKASATSPEELESKFEQEKQDREITHQSVVDSYERQLAAVTLNKDVVIDGLRKDLAETRGKNDGEMEEMIDQMKALEGENITLREKLELELQGKDQQIFALEHALHAQEQLLDNVRMEMDQLQSGMEHATQTRRGEVEEMQKEVMEIESRAMKQEREIVALKMQLEEGKLEHKAEVVKFKETIAALENESPLVKTMAELQNDDRMLEVRQRLETLKGHNTTLKEDNIRLGGQLERASIEIKRLELEMEHTKQLEEDCARLQKQVKQLEKILATAARSQAKLVANQAASPPSSSSASKSRPKPVADKENASASKSNKQQQQSSSSQYKKQPSPSREKKSKGKGGFGLFKRGKNQKKTSDAAMAALSDGSNNTSAATESPSESLKIGQMGAIQE